ncbi:MAG: apolipoprotein N-acyltransferase [Propionibacterium sp.]|nr:apolipoprotein N-acyltransferase [Propionibacterium sp.]
MISRPDLPRWLSALLAVAAGLLIGLGQPPMGLWPATMVGLALFTWLLARRRKRGAAGLGFLAGLAMNTLTISWISVLGVPVAIALILFMSLWYALAAIVISRVIRLPLWPVWVAATWVATEFASGNVPFGGFSWTRLAFTTTDQPLAGFLPYVGAAGVSFLVALLSQLLLTLTTRRRWLQAGSAVVATFVVGGLLLFVPPPPAEQSVTTAIVQPNVNRHEYGTAAYPRAVTNNALSSTVMALAQARTSGQHVDFVLWPESSTDHDPYLDPTARRQVELSAQLATVPILVGAVTLPEAPPDSRQTSGIWWDPVHGPGDVYHKRNLVPFGEWIPFRDVLLPRLPILQQIGRQSIAGETPGVIRTPVAAHPSLTIGNVICFELAYDDTVYDTVRHGGRVLVSQSNENTYAGTFQISQQFNMNRIRAKELRREVVVSTLNSVSGIVDARGGVGDLTDEYTGAARIVEAPLRYRETAAVTVGPIISRVALALSVGAFGWALVAGRRSARAGKLGTTNS